MSISNFNPVLWSAGFLANKNNAHVFGDVVNRDYEGEIKDVGDTVKIMSIGRVTRRTYTRNAGSGGTDLLPTITAIARPEILIGSELTLSITEQDYFNFAIDNIDAWQQKPKLMDKAMKEAAYAMADGQDFFISQTIQTGVAGTGDGTGNRLAARTIGTGAGDSDAYETLVDLGTLLDEANMFGDRWVVVPYWFVGALRKDDRFVGNGTPGNLSVLENGKVTKAAGFDIRASNNLSGATSGTLAVSGGVYTILAGLKEAVTFANQIDKIVAYTPDDGFKDAVRGLENYGCKATRPYGLASVAVTKA